MSGNCYRLLSRLAVLVGLPLAALSALYLENSRGYYISATLAVFFALAAFILDFEGRKPKTSEIVIISVMSAIAVAGRAAFAPFPQFKPMLAVIVTTAACFGAPSGCLVGVVSAFVSNFIFGQGPLTPWQMFGFGLCGLIAGAVLSGGGIHERLRKNKLCACFVGAFLAFVPYGALLNPASVLTLYGSEATLSEFAAAYVSGFPFDLVHAVSTFVFMYVLYKPFCDKLMRVKVKYGLH